MTAQVSKKILFVPYDVDTGSPVAVKNNNDNGQLIMSCPLINTEYCHSRTDKVKIVGEPQFGKNHDSEARKVISDLSHRHLDKIHRDLVHGNLVKSTQWRSSLPDLRVEEAKRRRSLRMDRLTSLEDDVKKADRVLAKVKAFSGSTEHLSISKRCRASSFESLRSSDV